FVGDGGPVEVVADQAFAVSERFDLPAVEVAGGRLSHGPDRLLDGPAGDQLSDGAADLVLRHVGDVAQGAAVHVHLERLAHCREPPGVGAACSMPEPSMPAWRAGSETRRKIVWAGAAMRRLASSTMSTCQSCWRHLVIAGKRTAQAGGQMIGWLACYR